MKKTSLELKVGIFVFMSLALLFYMTFKAGDFYMKPGYSVRFLFNFVSGIDTNSPVKLAGVTVGEVTAIRVVRDAAGVTQVEVIARINQGAYIEEDAEVRINSLGLLGEKYVEILPGTNGNKTLSNGGTLAGKNPVGFEKMTESGERVLGKIEKTFDHVNQVVADPEFKQSVKDTFVKASGTFGNAEVVAKNLMQTTEDLKDAAHSARIILGRLKDGEGTVGHLLKDDTIAKDLEAFVKEIKEHPWKLLKRD